MQATVNLRVLDANTFLRDSLIGSYQFDLLGIYIEKVVHRSSSIPKLTRYCRISASRIIK